MQKNINMKNVKEYVKKVNIYTGESFNISISVINLIVMTDARYIFSHVISVENNM